MAHLQPLFSNPRKLRVQNGTTNDARTSIARTADTRAGKSLQRGRTGERMDSREADAPHPAADPESDTARRVRRLDPEPSAAALVYRDLRSTQTTLLWVPAQKLFRRTSPAGDPSCPRQRQSHA